MNRLRPVTSALCALSVIIAAIPIAAPAVAREAYELHVRAEGGDGHSVNISLPWKRGHGGSPFDFTAKATTDDLTLEKLRWAWSSLQRLPEGQPVDITTRRERIRATRRSGYLVLEPQPAAKHDRARVKIPDYIVEATLARDGRLTDEDLDDLVRERGKIVLVKVTSTDGGVNVWIDRAGSEFD